jgi:hypothetical protein
MVIDQINQTLITLFSLVFTGYESEMVSLALYTVGMALYGILIWNYYRHLAKRDIFTVDFTKYQEKHGKLLFMKKIISVFFYIVKYLVIFPLYTFLWFGMISGFLFLLAKTQTVEGVLLIAITIVSAVRLSSYYSEDLSKDLAKMIPFALLGVFVVDPSFFSINLVYDRFAQIPGLMDVIWRYLLFVVLMEFGLKTMHGLVTFLIKAFGGKPKDELHEVKQEIKEHVKAAVKQEMKHEIKQEIKQEIKKEEKKLPKGIVPISNKEK